MYNTKNELSCNLQNMHDDKVSMQVHWLWEEMCEQIIFTLKNSEKLNKTWLWDVDSGGDCACVGAGVCGETHNQSCSKPKSALECGV